MKLTQNLAIVALAGSLFATTNVLAQTAQLSPSDTNFVNEVASGGRTAVAVAQHVQRSGSSQQVKDLARMVEKDHSNLNSELGNLTHGKGISLPAQPSGKPVATRDRLTALSGQQLDTAYLTALIEDHEAAIGLYRTEARDGQDPDIRKFATATVPKLEMHLQMIQDVKAGKPNMKMGDDMGTPSPTAPGERKAKNASGY